MKQPIPSPLYGACVDYVSALKMEAAFSIKKSMNFYRAARCHIAGCSVLHSHRCGNLKSDIAFTFLLSFVLGKQSFAVTNTKPVIMPWRYVVYIYELNLSFLITWKGSYIRLVYS
jgi:hypothetical protein